MCILIKLSLCEYTHQQTYTLVDMSVMYSCQQMRIRLSFLTATVSHWCKRDGALVHHLCVPPRGAHRLCSFMKLAGEPCLHIHFYKVFQLYSKENILKVELVGQRVYSGFLSSGKVVPRSCVPPFHQHRVEPIFPNTHRVSRVNTRDPISSCPVLTVVSPRPVLPTHSCHSPVLCTGSRPQILHFSVSLPKWHWKGINTIQLSLLRICHNAFCLKSLAFDQISTCFINFISDCFCSVLLVWTGIQIRSVLTWQVDLFLGLSSSLAVDFQEPS